MPGKFFIARSQIISCGVTDMHSFKKKIKKGELGQMLSITGNKYWLKANEKWRFMFLTTPWPATKTN